MDYQKIYNRLVEKRRNDPPKNCYVEHHNIKPKCLGGTDEKSNIVTLTAREHYIAHVLLAKIYKIYQLYSAVIYMQTGRHDKRQYKFNSKLYKKIREQYAQQHSIKMIGNKLHLGKHHSEETKQKISSLLKGTKLKEETKRKLSEYYKGMCFYNNGMITVRARECPDGFVRGRLSKQKTQGN